LAGYFWRGAVVRQILNAAQAILRTVQLEQCHFQGSADFPVCWIASFPTRRPNDRQRYADLEIGDTAGRETCATS
jgi:hypothetical protein